MILAHWVTGAWANTVWVSDTWGETPLPPSVGKWHGGLLYESPYKKKRKGIKATRDKIDDIREELHLKPLKDFDPAQDEDAELTAISYWAIGED